MKNLLIMFLGCLPLVPAVLYAGDVPRWWADRGVINNSADVIPNDFALVNQGQVKWIAIQCAREFESRLPNGAGEEIWDVIGRLSSDGYDNTVLNQGQLKALVLPFYDRLNPDYVGAYPEDVFGTDPWSFSDGLRNDYSAVNIGQLKRVFSFDFDRTELVPGDTISVSGSVTYSGSQLGNIIVVVSPLQVGFGTPYSAILSSPGAFSISGVPADRQVWVRAFLDTDGNGVGNGDEPWGESALNPFSSTGDITGVDIILSDVGDDGDSMDDWWELNRFGTLAQDDLTDFDADGVKDSQEYVDGTDPSTVDTDGDGLADDVDSNPLTADADGNGMTDNAETTLAFSSNTHGADGVLIHVPDQGWYHAATTNLILVPIGE